MVVLVVIIVGCAFAAHWGAKALEAFTSDDVKNRLNTVSGMLVFVMDGCGYCKDLEANVLSKLKNESDHVIVVKMAPENEPLIKEWNVRGFPTIFFLSKGQKMRPPGSGDNGEYEGPRDFQTIRDHLKTAIDGEAIGTAKIGGNMGIPMGPK
jgi:thiol-disulfide isomerase/thioredoxin